MSDRDDFLQTLRVGLGEGWWVGDATVHPNDYSVHVMSPGHHTEIFTWDEMLEASDPVALVRSRFAKREGASGG